MDLRRNVVDQRSKNGTTINAEFIPYGTSRTVEDGDIIVLAGVQLYNFSKIDRSYFFFLRSWFSFLQSWFPFFQSSYPEAPTVSPWTWGLLIDGSAKRLVSLTAERYWLEESNKELKVGPTRTDTALLEIRRPVPGKPTIIYRGKPNVLFVVVKGNEYQYQPHPLEPNIEYNASDDAEEIVAAGVEFPASSPFVYGRCTCRAEDQSAEDADRPRPAWLRIPQECTGVRFQIIRLLSNTDNSGEPAD
jgi:hypothetical protein